MKKIIVSFIVALLSIGSFGVSYGVASAQYTYYPPSPYYPPSSGPTEVTLTGTVAGKMDTVIVLRTGGEDVRIGVNQYTRIIDRFGNLLSLSRIDIGDRIRVSGTPTGGTEPGRVRADTIVNLSSHYNPYPGYGYPLHRPPFYENRYRPPFFFGDEQTLTGIVSAKIGGSLIVRTGGMDVRVLVRQDTRILNRNGRTISFSRVDVGDRVQVFGAWSYAYGIGQTFRADTLIDVNRPR